MLNIPLLLVSLAVGPADVAHGPARNPDAAVQEAQARRQTAKPQSRPTPARSSGIADAYYLFLRARQMEIDGDAQGAIKLYQEASRLDPRSGEILAEMAALYARQDRVADALATAQAALKVDPDTVEAHWILGSIYAAYAQDDQRQAPTAASRAAEKDYAVRAVAELQKVLDARGNTADPSLLITLGRLYLRTAAPDKAIPVLTRFVDQEPEATEGLALLAEAYAEAGRNPDAIRVLGQAADREPSFLPSLAQLYERAGRWEDAADTYKRAADQGTASPEMKRRWAAALLNTRRPGDALKARDVLRQIVADNPKDSGALYLLVQAQREGADYQGAEATARQMLALDPDNPSGAYALAQVYEQQREYRKVVDTLQPVVDRMRPEDAVATGVDLTPVLMHLAFAYIDLEQPDRAIPLLDRAKKAAPEDTTIDVGLVQAEVAAKRYKRAEELAQDARTRHPEDTRLARLQADVLRRDNQADRAVSILEEVLNAHPEDPSNAAALAELLMSADRNAQAERVLQQARAKFPDDLSVLFDLGAVYERQKRYTEAEDAFKQVLARDPLHAQALNYLGYMLADRGLRLQESVDYIRRALTVEPNNPSYLDSLGWAYFKMNRLDLAEANLRRAVTDRPDDSAVQDHWGDLLLKLGRRAEAVAAWQRALAGEGQDINRAAIEAKIRSAGEKAVKK